MRFSKNYSKLNYPIFTTIRKNNGYYKEGQTITVNIPDDKQFYAEIVSIRNMSWRDITETIAIRDADCSRKELIELMYNFYKSSSHNLILITLMKK